jgi:hypothetical protein
MEVGKDPETEPEAIVAQVGEEALRLREAGRGELEVQAVLVLHPLGVDVEHVARDALLAQPAGDGGHLVARAVAVAPHPQPERPGRGHAAAAGERRVLRHDLLGLADEQEEVEHGPAEVEHRAPS